MEMLDHMLHTNIASYFALVVYLVDAERPLMDDKWL